MDSVGLSLEPLSDSTNRSKGEFDAVIFFRFQVFAVDGVVSGDGVTESRSLAAFHPNDHCW